MQQVVRYRTPHGGAVHGLIVKETKKKVHFIGMEPGLPIRRLPLEEKRHMVVMDKRPNKVRKQLRAAGRQWEYSSTDLDGVTTQHNRVSKASKEALRG